MRHRIPTLTPSLLSLLTATLLLHTRPTTSTPFLSGLSSLSNGTHILQARCDSPCGYYGQVCCTSGEVCYTDPTNQQASCSASVGAAQITAAPTASSGCDTCESGQGSWVYWTSTYTQTNLVEYCSTYSSWVPVATVTVAAPQTTAAAVQCDTGSGECSCGPICCSSSQYCKWEGQCADLSSSVVVVAQTVYHATSYESYTAPLRPTSIATVTATVVTVPTTTVGFQPAVTTGANVTIAQESTSSGLSGGAIAGIVIGVIIGIIILILLCICLCFGAAASSIWAFFFGGRKNRRRKTEEVREHRHSSRADGRSWYGNGQRPAQRKKESGFGWKGVAALGAGFLAAVGIKRAVDNRKERRDEKSDYSSSYGSYFSDERTEESASSDRRTHSSRRGPSRGPSGRTRH